jgi:hypothetical protein
VGFWVVVPSALYFFVPVNEQRDARSTRGDLRGDLQESSSQPSCLKQSAQLVRVFHHEKPLQIDSIGQNRGFIRL